MAVRRSAREPERTLMVMSKSNTPIQPSGSVSTSPSPSPFRQSERCRQGYTVAGPSHRCVGSNQPPSSRWPFVAPSPEIPPRALAEQSAGRLRNRSTASRQRPAIERSRAASLLSARRSARRRQSSSRLRHRDLPSRSSDKCFTRAQQLLGQCVGCCVPNSDRIRRWETTLVGCRDARTSGERRNERPPDPR